MKKTVTLLLALALALCFPLSALAEPLIGIASKPLGSTLSEGDLWIVLVIAAAAVVAVIVLVVMKKKRKN